jgi:phosphatidylglycerophosphatase A
MTTRLLLATAGGLGLLKPAPGTWGSLPPVAVAVALTPLGWPAVLIGLAVLFVASSIACIGLAGWYEKHFGRADPGQVVCDEVAGMSLCLLLLPWHDPDWRDALVQAGLAFLLFRLFDIFKPPPIDQSQRLPGGWGVLIDDLLAGIAAAGVLWGLWWLASLLS